MTVEEALQQFDDSDLVSLAWLVTFVTEHEEQVKKLLEKHDVEYTGDPMDSINKIITLSGMRGSYFTGDLQDVAREAHYFSLGNVVPKIKGFFGNVAGALSTIAAPVVTAVTGVPGAGAAAAGLLSGVHDMLQNKPDDAQAPSGQQAAPIDTPKAIEIAQHVKDIAKAAEDDDDTPTFWDENKNMIIGAIVFVVILVIAIILYLRWKKKHGAKAK